ncbi:hypothetical protein GPECTOR_22g823 [Gonium pectorale]|uniref:Uncharacterized protein n=1 Tax=Gonium pectorale TaxID=33097 RepID=A0A150GHA6_GONPE|nr:hypothetical protein GPECTOR_22g823 [Gonium pectorale]|eukprot:KXZ49232.1 hypothetical protein GPECTOR_22g823 [Gonium pectorale]
MDPGPVTTAVIAAPPPYGSSNMPVNPNGTLPPSYSLPVPSVTTAHAATAPASSSFSAAMAAAAAAALGSHALPATLPVPSANGPVPQAPSSSLGPAAYMPPLHFPPPHQYGSVAASDAAPSSQHPAAGKAGVRESPRDTYSSGSMSGSPGSSTNQVQQQAGAAGPYGSSGAGASGTVAPGGLRSASLANAPQPVGLPPPSPVKAAPPAVPPPSVLRAQYIRSNSSRSSTGSENNPPYTTNSILASSIERDDQHQGQHNGSASGAAQQPQYGQPQTPTRPGYSAGSSIDGTMASAAATVPPSSSGYSTPHGGSSSGAPGHVTWSAGVAVAQSTAPSTPTRPSYSGLPYSDSAAGRRASTGSQLGSLEVGSPFARGTEGFSRMLVEHGTLTCVRPSTVPSNFAADSQQDFSGMYGMYGDNTVSPSPGSVTEGHSGPPSGAVPVSVVEVASSTTAPPPVASASRPWEAGAAGIKRQRCRLGATGCWYSGNPICGNAGRVDRPYICGARQLGSDHDIRSAPALGPAFATQDYCDAAHGATLHSMGQHGPRHSYHHDLRHANHCNPKRNHDLHDRDDGHRCHGGDGGRRNARVPRDLLRRWIGRQRRQHE